MAIQLPNPGIGDGKTGDNEYLMWTKTKDNFSEIDTRLKPVEKFRTDHESKFTNQTYAASRLVGTTLGKVPTAEKAFEASFSTTPDYFTELPKNSEGVPDLNLLTGGVKAYGRGDMVANFPQSQDNWGYVETRATNVGSTQARVQVKYPYSISDGLVSRVYVNNVWTEWESVATSKLNYNRTTATGANVVIDATGKLHRFSSSMKYKDLIGDLTLSDENYEKAMEIHPIVYRSKSEADPKNWHFLSFNAEQLGEYDPALTQWEITTHDKETGEELLEPKREAESINLNAVCAVLHATNIKQAGLIKSLEDRVTALESK